MILLCPWHSSEEPWDYIAGDFWVLWGGGKLVGWEGYAQGNKLAWNYNVLPINLVGLMAMVENTDAANGPETVGDSNALAQQMPKTFAHTTVILARHIHLDGFDSYFGQGWRKGTTTTTLSPST